MGLSFLKTGAESVKAAQQNQAEIETHKENQGKLWRFWLEDGEEARITFVDGDLNPEFGVLTPPRCYEHNLLLNGKFGNFFVCPAKTNPGEACCIDESGDRSYLAAFFTIIDHRTYTSKKKEGKTYTNTRKLLVAKPDSFEMLNKLAIKIGGLAGSTWDVSRVGDKAANIGSQFFPVGKTPIAELQALYQNETKDPQTNAITKATYFLPANYEQELVYRDNMALLKLGLGKPNATMGNPGQPYIPAAAPATANYASVL